MRKLRPIEATCKVCEKTWMVSGSDATCVRTGRKKYCSKVCLGVANSINMRGKPRHWLNTPEVKSKAAANRVGKIPTGENHPDWGKKSERSGEKHWNWKGGITSPSKTERERFRKMLQRIVFKRDDYTCQICDQSGGSLQVDHIKKWADYPELRFEPSNCRTLCMACHYYVTFKRKLPQGVVWGHNLSRRIAS
jgi:5-methylcytosine-specific restriction endonuclease McrA